MSGYRHILFWSEGELAWERFVCERGDTAAVHVHQTAALSALKSSTLSEQCSTVADSSAMTTETEKCVLCVRGGWGGGRRGSGRGRGTTLGAQVQCAQLSIHGDFACARSR